MKMPSKIKPCRICGGKRLRNLTICYDCFRQREKAKRRLKIIKLKERKKRKIEKEHNSYGYLFGVADKMMSLIVRKKGADANGFNLCYTCYKRLPYKELHAGHFWHSKLDFDFRNRRPQCPGCNTYRSGNLAVFGTKLAQELGVEGLKQLDHDAHTKIYTWLELKQIIEDFKKMLG